MMMFTRTVTWYGLFPLLCVTATTALMVFALAAAPWVKLGAARSSPAKAAPA